MGKVLYEHYFRWNMIGDKFDRSLVEPATNPPYFGNKPINGFWASRVDAEYGWKQWCKDNEPYWTMGKSFIFTLTDDTKVLSIKSKDDLGKIDSYIEDSARLYFPSGINNNMRLINFEKMAKDYDALEVDGSKLYWEFYGWDCDSIVIFNPDVIEEVNESDRDS